MGNTVDRDTQHLIPAANHFAAWRTVTGQCRVALARGNKGLMPRATWHFFLGGCVDRVHCLVFIPRSRFLLVWYTLGSLCRQRPGEPGEFGRGPYSCNGARVLRAATGRSGWWRLRVVGAPPSTVRQSRCVSLARRSTLATTDCTRLHDDPRSRRRTEHSGETDILFSPGCAHWHGWALRASMYCRAADGS